MLLVDGPGQLEASEAARERPLWSVLVPFFNERGFLPATLAARAAPGRGGGVGGGGNGDTHGRAAQDRAVRVVGIDNGSTDGSAAIARELCERLGLDYLLITERRPGKVNALAAGLRWVDTPFVATCDADTWYPADYLTQAQAVLERGHAIAGAFFVAEASDAAARERAGRRICATAKLLRGQCHTGGAGQAFRTDALRAAGGFDATRWGWVLEDHEVIHQVMKLGTMGYAEGLWCVPSSRPRDRDSIRWTLAERLLYATTAPVIGDWFFYRFLGPRLQARKLTSDRIRERRHHEPERLVSAPAYSMC